MNGTNAVNTIRQSEVFPAAKFNNLKIPVRIIGCGAIGSKIAMHVAKLGVELLTCYDFDTVDAVNVSNQIYGNNDLDKPKVEALAARIKQDTGLEIEAINKKVDGSEQLDGIVFMVPDTMAARREIWEKGLKWKPYTQVVIDGRMGKREGRVYTIKPFVDEHITGYEPHLAKEATVESACGQPISVDTTASIFAGIAVQQMITWFNVEHTQEQKESELGNELIIWLSPFNFIKNDFS